MIVLQSMEIEVELLITVYIDSIRVIFLVNNHATNNHTKYVDICNLFIHEYIEDGMVKLNL